MQLECGMAYFHTHNQPVYKEMSSKSISDSTSSDSDDENSLFFDPPYLCGIGMARTGGVYRSIAEIGRGYFSSVHLVLAQDGSLKVLKICKSASSFISSAEDERRAFRVIGCRATGTKRLMLSNHIFTFACSVKYRKHIAIAQELMQLDLHSFVSNFTGAKMEADMAIHIMHQILEGLSVLHDDCGIVHTDIKPENILVGFCEHSTTMLRRIEADILSVRKDFLSQRREIRDNCELSRNKKRKAVQQAAITAAEKSKRIAHSIQKLKPTSNCTPQCLQIKITDFGSTEKLNSQGRFVVHKGYPITTRPYRAPEVIAQKRMCDAKVDIWSAGCLLYELITGEDMFYVKGCTDATHLHIIKEFTQPNVCNFLRLKKPTLEKELSNNIEIDYAVMRVRHQPSDACQCSSKVFDSTENAHLVQASILLAACTKFDAISRPTAKHLVNLISDKQEHKQEENKQVNRDKEEKNLNFWSKKRNEGDQVEGLYKRTWLSARILSIENSSPTSNDDNTMCNSYPSSVALQFDDDLSKIVYRNDEVLYCIRENKT